MKKQSVTRVSIALTALFAAASASFAWRASAALSPGAASTAPGAGEAALLFRRHCAACHTESELAPRLAGPDAEAAAAELFELLADHGDSDDAEDARIVEHLRAIAVAPAELPR